MNFDVVEPCTSCPYRKSAKLKLWHPKEFANLLRQDADPLMGHVFGCHQGRSLPVAKRSICAGWFLNQKSRGFPSIQLRLLIMKHNFDVDTITTGGHKLYKTLLSMCRANGVGK